MPKLQYKSQDKIKCFKLHIYHIINLLEKISRYLKLYKHINFS